MTLTVVETPGELTRYEAAKRAIAEAKAVDEVKSIHDKATAIRAYAKQVNDKQMEIDAVEIRIRAERRLGEMLQQQKETVGLAPAGRPRKIGADAEPISDKVPTLAEVGIDKKLSARSQAIAAIPEEDFETALSEHRDNQKAVTQATMDKLAKQGEEAKSEEERRREKSGRPEWMSVEEFRQGVSAGGWVNTFVLETRGFDPGHIATRCLPDNIVPLAIKNTKTAIEWLERFLHALEERRV